jgi:hypothetical protein
MSQPEKHITKRSYSWFKKFQYDPDRDSPSDARNVLLVVVIDANTIPSSGEDHAKHSGEDHAI